MNKYLRSFFRHVLYNLRGGFLIRPLIVATVLGCLGAFLSMTEETFPGMSNWVPHLLFPSRSDPQVAQTILGIIAGSMMTVVSIVFAILLMTLTLASMQYSPRILVAFAQDRVTQQTLGIFLGTFTYCLAALPAARSLPHPTEPVLTVIGGMLLALACVAWLLYFIHHISQAIGVNYIVDRIAHETEEIINLTMPRPRGKGRLSDGGSPVMDARQAPILSENSGYVRYIDTKRLVALAKSYGLAIRIQRRVGHFVPAGMPLLTVSKGDKMTDGRIVELRSTFDLGPTRTLEQDIEFGILQIVDIALKAISPAVNDPSTAITCVDHLSRILIHFASREPHESLYYDPPGFVRLSLPWLGFERLADSAFEQIRMYAKSDVAVSLRMLRALIDIATSIPEPSERKSLIARGRRIVAGCAAQMGEDEVHEMRTRMIALEALAKDPVIPPAPDAASA
jgi:uncharacterized membrane protein